MRDSGTPGPGAAVTAALDTPGRRTWRLLSRASREFGATPLAVIAGFAALAALSIVGDQSHSALANDLRHAIGHFIGKQASSAALQAIATGLVTVTSITFSVLLLAVQQTATNLSPVVFDQFVRRKSNQALLGFFIGLALFAYVVLAAVQDGTPPILGAAIATVMTVAALLFLLVLVYTTINQMRPTNVIRHIHDRTLAARDREAQLLRRTRREELSRDPVSATYRAEVVGYVTGIDLDRLERALEQIPDAEIRLHVTLGDHVAFGDAIATVRDDDEEDARRLADEVRGAVLIGQHPDLDHDATTGINELGNIAWTSTSTAKQSPEVGRQALHALRDIAARWLAEDLTPGRNDAHGSRARLAIVYPDNDVAVLLNTLYSMLVVAHESHQHSTAAAVLDAYRTLLDRAEGEPLRRLRDSLDTAAPLLDDMPPSPELTRARHEVQRALARR